MTITIIILLAIIINALLLYIILKMCNFTLKKYINSIESMGEISVVYYVFLHLINVIMTIFILIAINNTFFHFQY